MTSLIDYYLAKVLKRVKEPINLPSINAKVKLPKVKLNSSTLFQAGVSLVGIAITFLVGYTVLSNVSGALTNNQTAAISIKPVMTIFVILTLLIIIMVISRTEDL